MEIILNDWHEFMYQCTVRSVHVLVHACALSSDVVCRLGMGRPAKKAFLMNGEIASHEDVCAVQPAMAILIGRVAGPVWVSSGEPLIVSATLRMQALLQTESPP